MKYQKVPESAAQVEGMTLEDVCKNAQTQWWVNQSTKGNNGIRMHEFMAKSVASAALVHERAVQETMAKAHMQDKNDFSKAIEGLMKQLSHERAVRKGLVEALEASRIAFLADVDQPTKFSHEKGYGESAAHDGPCGFTDTIYHLAGDKVGHALTLVRAALTSLAATDKGEG